MKEKPILVNEPSGKFDKYLSREGSPAQRNNPALSSAEERVRNEKSFKKIPNYQDWLNPNFYAWHKGLRYEKLIGWHQTTPEFLAKKFFPEFEIEMKNFLEKEPVLAKKIF